MQYNKVGETMYKIMIVEDDELISKKLESLRHHQQVWVDINQIV